MKPFLVTYKHRRRQHTGRIAAPDIETARRRFQMENPDVFIVGVRPA